MNTILLVFFLILLSIHLIQQTKKPKNFPPGPSWLPYVGNQFYLRKLRRSLGGFHLALSYLATSYKTGVLGLKLGKEYVVSVSEYSVIQLVFTHTDFEGRPNNFFLKLRNFGRPRSGIVGSDGEIWTTNRKFVVRHLRTLGFGKPAMDIMIKNEINEVLDILKHEGLNVSIGKLFAPGILNILWTLVSGTPINRTDKLLNELLDLLALRGQLFDTTGGLLNQYPWLRFFAPKWTGYSVIQEINRKLKTLIENSVQEHYKTWTEGKDDDLIYSYITEINNNKNSSLFCDEELMVICLDIFIAGSQTTSGALELLFFIMITYPEIQKKVQEEIDMVVGNTSVVDYSDLKRLPYTSAVLLELHRHSHVLPITGPRRAMRDTNLNGYFIPKGTTILIDLYTMHYNEKKWKNPEIFNPERFLNKNGKLKFSEKIAPFGLGKRRCLGEILAKQCLFYYLVEILRRFTVRMKQQDSSENPLVGITMARTYKAQFIQRE